MNFNQLKEDLQPESFTTIATQKTTLAQAYRNAIASRNQSIRDDLGKQFNLLPTNGIDRLLHRLKSTAINLVDDQDVVVYLEGITNVRGEWVLETTSHRLGSMTLLSQVTIEGLLVIMDHTELILES